MLICLVIALMFGLVACSKQTAPSDPLTMQANVKATSQDAGTIPIPAYEVTLTIKANRPVTLYGVDVLLVDRHADALRSSNTFPGGKHLTKGETYTMDCMLPVPLGGGSWYEKVNLVVDFPGFKNIIATRFVQLPDYKELHQNKYGTDFDLPPMYGETKFDADGNVVK